MLPGIGAKKMPPTLNHRPAIWECMLGTVYAMNDKKEVKYFDYNYKEAREFANISKKKDVRRFRKKRHVRYSDSWMDPRINQMVLWVEKGG